MFIFLGGTLYQDICDTTRALLPPLPVLARRVETGAVDQIAAPCVTCAVHRQRDRGAERRDPRRVRRPRSELLPGDALRTMKRY